ncbi:hypothetical protein OROGR_015998 [Orobanche gracilis]
MLFDDVNGKVLTYSAQDCVYKVFDLKNYTMLYSISDKNVQEIKISPDTIDVSDVLPGPRPAGSINISNILTGKCLAKIKAGNSLPAEDKCTCGGQKCNARCIKASRLKSTVAEALEDITALFYDEDRNGIYTGNQNGLVHVWSN